VSTSFPLIRKAQRGRATVRPEATASLIARIGNPARKRHHPAPTPASGHNRLV